MAGEESKSVPGQERERNLSAALDRVATEEARRTFARLAAAAGAKAILDDFEQRKEPK